MYAGFRAGVNRGREDDIEEKESSKRSRVMKMNILVTDMSGTTYARGEYVANEKLRDFLDRTENNLPYPEEYYYKVSHHDSHHEITLDDVIGDTRSV